MLKPLSVFVGHRGELEEVLRALAEIVGQQFTRENLDVGAAYRCRAFDTEFTLVSDHGLDDDCGIEFSRYGFQLSLRAFSIGQHTPGYEAMHDSLALFLGARLSSRLRCMTIVVANLQREVARFGF
jgi:hypothetical protein